MWNDKAVVRVKDQVSTLGDDKRRDKRPLHQVTPSGFLKLIWDEVCKNLRGIGYTAGDVQSSKNSLTFMQTLGQFWRLRQTSQLAEIPWDHDDAVRPLLSWLK